MNLKAHVTWNFNCIFETERLLKVTSSHVNCKFSSMSETVPDSRCYYRSLTGSDTWPIE